MFLYDIDDLEGIVESNMQERQKAAETIHNILMKLNADFQWINTLGVIPLISSLREKAFNIQTDVMTSLEENYQICPNEKEKSLVNI